jgi:DNA-binding NtrC family response regulator
MIENDSSGKTILIVDDSPEFQQLMRFTLERSGFEVITSDDGMLAKDLLDTNQVDLVISDYKMPRMDGLQLLRALREKRHTIPYILMTAHGSVESTLEAMNLGAIEYLTKPFEPAEIIRAARKALNLSQEEPSGDSCPEDAGSPSSFLNIIGSSAAMQVVYQKIRKAVRNSSNILITGETGTGKELVARAIHYNGPRRNRSFIAVNCSVFSEGVLESELFGHVKGAFTSAFADHMGRFELADGGTLLLDEIGDMPLSVQVKLLRVLQEKQFERVGGTQTIRSDFRLIAATNRDLTEMMKNGTFREDLYYRLSVVRIEVPAMRKRREDIPLLVKYFLSHYSHRYGKDIKTLSLEAMRALQACSWPGNVRQLENAIESGVAMCDGSMIQLKDLPTDLYISSTERDPQKSQSRLPLPTMTAQFEREIILGAMERSGWIMASAARDLGISDRVLAYKMKKYCLTGQAQAKNV